MNLTAQLELETKQKAEAEENRHWRKFALAYPEWNYQAAKMAFFDFIHPEIVTFDLLVKASAYIAGQVGSLSPKEIQKAISADEQAWLQHRKDYHQRLSTLAPADLRSLKAELDQEAARLNQEGAEIQARKSGRILPDQFPNLGLTAAQIKAMPKEELRKLLYDGNGDPRTEIIKAVNAILKVNQA